MIFTPSLCSVVHFFPNLAGNSRFYVPASNLSFLAFGCNLFLSKCDPNSSIRESHSTEISVINSSHHDSSQNSKFLNLGPDVANWVELFCRLLLLGEFFGVGIVAYSRRLYFFPQLNPVRHQGKYFGSNLHDSDPTRSPLLKLWYS